MVLNKIWWRFSFLPIVTLICSPWFTYEPFDNVKLLFLGLSAALAIVQVSKADLRFNSFRAVPVSISGLFIFAMLIPLFMSGSPLAQQIYGAAGRSLGFLHYFFLFCIFLGICYSKLKLDIKLFIKALIATGLFESSYAGIQYLNLDPIGWDNSSNWIFGTFGNPNFLSAFLGMSACASLYVRKLHFKMRWVVLGYLNLLVSVAVILLSNSVQGLFIFAFGIYLTIQVSFFHRSRVMSYLFLTVSAVGASVISLGVFGKGVLSGILYQDSTAFRGDYWRAGWKMFQNNVFTGIGLDSYGDNYRAYRDVVAANRRGLDVYSTSAHNIYVDLAATGGIMLLTTFISFSLFITIVMISNLRRSNFTNPEQVLLAVLWIGYQLQLIVSINVSSVAIWGFVVAGLIVYSAVDLEKNVSLGSNPKAKSPKKNYSLFSGFTILVLTLNISLVAPLLLRDVQLASAISASSSIQLQKVTTSWPQSCFYLAKTEEALSQIQDFSSSLAVSEKSVSLNSKCFDSWRHIFENPTSSEETKAFAWNRMLELDPNLLTS